MIQPADWLINTISSVDVAFSADNVLPNQFAGLLAANARAVLFPGCNFAFYFSWVSVPPVNLPKNVGDDKQ